MNNNKIICHILTIKDKSEIISKYRNQLPSSYDLTITSGKDQHLEEIKFDLKLAQMIYPRELTPGEKNCARGHKKMWEQALNKPKKWQIFLEDDAIIDSNFESVVEDIIKYDSNKPTAIILGRSKTIHRNLWFENIKIPFSVQYKVGNIHLGEKEQNFFGTVGYMLNDAALKLLDELPYVFWKADDWTLFNNYGLKILHLRKPCIWEDFMTHESTTGNKNAAQHKLWTKSILREIFVALKNNIK